MLRNAPPRKRLLKPEPHSLNTRQSQNSPIKRRLLLWKEPITLQLFIIASSFPREFGSCQISQRFPMDETTKKIVDRSLNASFVQQLLSRMTKS